MKFFVEDEERLQMQREKKKVEEMIRKEELQLKNLSKDYNTERARKKKLYQEQELREKIKNEITK